MVSSKMSTECVLQLLENGKWHYIKDLPKETALNPLTVKYITKFLAKYNLVMVDNTKQRIKLEKSTTEFFQKVRHLEISDYS